MSSIWLLALLHVVIAWRIAPALPEPWGWAFAALMLASLVLIPAAFYGRRAQDRRVADRWSWAGMLALGLFAMLLTATLLREVVLLVAWPLGRAGPLAEPSAIAAPLLALGAVLVGFVGARGRARVRTVELPIADLAPALHGFTIVQISDVHVGPTVKRGYVQRIVDAVNALDADAVAITGDLVYGRVRDLVGDVAPLAQLRARDGVYFVTGNHEYYSGAADWTAHLRTLGIEVLTNEHKVLPSGLLLAGVTDWSAQHFVPAERSDPQRAIAGAPAHARPRVLLAHQPRSAAAAAEAGFDVQLSGHTHGGQFWPFNHFVRLQQPYTAGLHRLGAMWVYVSRGTGYWGPPLRLLAPSEITRVRLVPASG